MRNHINTILIYFIIIAITTLYYFGVFSFFDNKIFDLLITFNKKINVSNNIVIIDIDEKTLNLLSNKIGKWPYPRRIHSKINKFLKGSKAVLYDVIFSEKSNFVFTESQIKWINKTFKNTNNIPEEKLRGTINNCKKVFINNDELFEKSLKENGNIFLALQGSEYEQKNLNLQTDRLKLIDVNNNTGLNLPKYKGITLPINDFIPHLAGLGHINFIADKDGVSRKSVLIININDKLLMPSISLSLLSKLKGANNISIDRNYKNIIDVYNLKIGDLKIPLTDDLSYRINYYGGYKEYTYFPFWKID